MPCHITIGVCLSQLTLLNTLTTRIVDKIALKMENIVEDFFDKQNRSSSSCWLRRSVTPYRNKIDITVLWYIGGGR